ncbi:hypothetical protein K402DRAFT_418401 [Aulographum hederae CBS 113979]|uniref:Homeobox and C2H2 transcription factor n=1 Tax=Aulographum hederae CBS 113979 TaxID=1176131 RepID=A0A6G1H9J2_9PEZI|nr:hypothetical protein K402DRAFT_418401 [Aulographum hederae CBS 113979]
MEAEQASQQPQMAQFFDFGEASMPEAMPSVQEPATMGMALGLDDMAELDAIIMSNQELDRQNGSEADLSDAAIMADPTLGMSIDESGRMNFAAWIPRYKKPQAACEYCRSKKLECFFTYEGQDHCSPCNALFRTCSFVQELSSHSVMDTLHTVPEASAQEIGGPTGIAALKSWDRCGFDVVDQDEECGSKKSGTRFSRTVIKILKDWMDEHRDHPYPSEEDKEELMTKTGLKASQVTNWLANFRRRHKAKSRAPSPSTRIRSAAIDIPIGAPGLSQQGKSWAELNPLQRWQNSPPENEPASVTDIAQAVANTQYHPVSSRSSSRPGSFHQDESSATGSHHRAPSTTSVEQLRAPSVTSCETGLSSGSYSNLSQGTAWSHGSRNSFGSRNSMSSLGSINKKSRRRRKLATRPSKLDGHDVTRPFQCTFCTDTFKSKYDWSRHEKSLHLSLEKWICAPLGEVMTDPATGEKICVYCDLVNPSPAHLEIHNHRACEEKGLEARTFFRKDHLRQHLRLMHGCRMTERMESCKTEPTYLKCRCGFCGAEFTRWQDRVDHLAKHFRSGAKIREWKGCRGLEPQVASLVQNAMPPYLIGNEAKSPFPFSASNEASLIQNTMSLKVDLEATVHAGATWDFCQDSQSLGIGSSNHRNSSSSTTNLTSPRTPASFNSSFPSAGGPKTPVDCGGHRPTVGLTTCWEVLTVRLGQYVVAARAAGATDALTDEMLQRQARTILYEDDDSWNQTAADNPEWLNLFKRAHGLSTSKPVSRGWVLEELGVDVGDGVGAGTAGVETGDADLDLNFNDLNFGDLDLPGVPEMPCSGAEMEGLERTGVIEGGGFDPLSFEELIDAAKWEAMVL